MSLRTILNKNQYKMDKSVSVEEPPRLEIILKRLNGLHMSMNDVVASISRRTGNILNYPPDTLQDPSPNKGEEKCCLDAIDIEIARLEYLYCWLITINAHMGKII